MVNTSPGGCIHHFLLRISLLKGDITLQKWEINIPQGIMKREGLA